MAKQKQPTNIGRIASNDQQAVAFESSQLSGSLSNFFESASGVGKGWTRGGSRWRVDEGSIRETGDEWVRGCD